MPLPTPTSKSHLTVPSSERCSERIAGGVIAALAFSFSRSDLARSVMASKSATPRWCIHWKTWRARNGFSPCAANHSVSAGNVMSSRFTRSSIGCALPRVHPVRRKEIADLRARGVGRIGAVHRVGVDRLREIGADRALGGLLRIGRAHEVAVAQDRALAFEHLDL